MMQQCLGGFLGLFSAPCAFNCEHMQRKRTFTVHYLAANLIMQFVSAHALQWDHHSVTDCLNNAALCCWLAPPLHFLTALTALNVNGLYLTPLQGNDVKLKP